MESCVLIPPEFGLVMLARPGQLMEMTATLWTRRVIVPGMEFFPDRGEIRLDRLEIFSRVDSSDIRTKYGCTEDIWSVEGTEVRHCNWVRFLRTCSDPTEANMIASKIDSHTVYKALKCIPPNTEIVAYLEPIDVQESVDVEEMAPKRIKLEPEVTEAEDMRLRFSPVSPVLPCSPVARDDECFSGVSDDASVDMRSERSRSKSDSSEEDSLMAMDLTLSRQQAISPPTRVSPPVRRNRERTWLPCEVCGKKFDRPSLLKRHMRTHTGEKPHACDVCGKAFSTSSSLNTHRRIHSGEKPHQCQQCGKCFTASSNLYYHRMTHNKEKPHKCSLCSKSFPTPGDLKSHMYVHNGSWPFKCDICNRGFSKQANLKNHLILHTGEKPFECHLCSKKFALQCNLKTHVKSHDGEAQEACAKCGKGFLASSKQLYNGHCKSCFSVSPGSDSLSDKSSNSSPGRLSDFSISSLTSCDKKDSYNQNRQSTPLRRSSAGTSPSTPNLSHPVALSGAHGHATGSPYFSGSLPVSPFPMMPNSPTLDRQFYIQGLYNKMMDDKAFSSQSSVIRDGYLNRPQMAMMAAHY